MILGPKYKISGPKKGTKKETKNRSVIPYKAFLKEITIPGPKYKIPGPKKRPKKRQKSLCHSL